MESTLKKEEYSKETLERIVQREKNGIIGRREVIAFDGIVTTFSSAAIIGSGIHLVKTIPALPYQITSQGIPENILTVLGIGASIALVSLATLLLKWDLPRFKENIRMLKYEKEWLKRDSELLKKASERETKIIEENKIYQKTPTK